MRRTRHKLSSQSMSAIVRWKYRPASVVSSPSSPKNGSISVPIVSAAPGEGVSTWWT